jgi:miniconductance mechanosensitive channel
MTPEQIQDFMDAYPTLSPWGMGAGMVVIGVLVFINARYLIGRGLVYVASRTESRYDDIVVSELHPFRFAWIAPLLVIHYFANLLPTGGDIVRQVVLFGILWLVVITVNSLLKAANTIYESSHFYRGEPIQGYLDLGKIALILVAIILTISLFTRKSPAVLLGGLGAIMAILLLVFRDTLMSFVASIQIQSNDLVKEGDAVEVPSYGADGVVLNMALHTVTIQNWDKSLSMIPTHKLLDTPYKNWRGMLESGGRRIKRSVHIDLNSIRFCDPDMIARLEQIGLIRGSLQARLAEIEEWNRSHNASPDDPIEGRQLTNLGVFQSYVISYLKSRPDLHQEGMTLLVRQRAPSPVGIPLEIYAFTKTVVWADFEAIQAEIIDHMLAAMPQFGLRVFQEPTGLDFQAWLGPEHG